MGTPPTDYLLMKLDKIEDLVRIEAAEIRKILTDRGQTATPATLTSVLSARIEKWVFSLKPLAAGAAMVVKHAIAVATIVYMAKGGSLGAVEPYVQWLLGM